VHCELDIAGMLATSTVAESLEMHEPSEVALPLATAGLDEDDDNVRILDEKLEYGQRKRKRMADRQYDAFWWYLSAMSFEYLQYTFLY